MVRISLPAHDGFPITITVPSGPLPTEARVAELSAAFDRVKNPEHWKGPIDAVVRVTTGAGAADMATILEAIEFYTATTGIVHDLGDGRFRILAPGYWAGPAN